MLALVQAVTLVARGDDGLNPCGFVLARCVCGEAEILSIAVDPRSRRRGIARKLMETLIESLNEAQARDLFLEVDIANSAALGLYRGLGFVEAGRRRGYYAGAGGPSDALVLRLDLEAGAAAGFNMAQKPL